MGRRNQRRLRKLLARENPIGKVYTSSTGYAGSPAGQQELITLPLSLYQSEIRGLYSNYGAYGGSVSTRTGIMHSEYVDPGGQPQAAINQAVAVTAAGTLANGIRTVLKEWIYTYDTSRKYQFKNHGNQNMEIVAYLVECTESITNDMYDCLSASNTASAISELVKNNAQNENDPLNNVLEPYGINTSTTTGAGVSRAEQAVNANNAMDAEDDIVLDGEGAASTFGGVTSKFKNWARIGFTPSEVKSFRKHFRITKRKRKILKSNEVMEYNWFTNNIRKIDARTLDSPAADSMREVHTVAGTKWLVLVIRGLPAVMQFAAAANIETLTRQMWAYDETSDGIGRTGTNLAAATDVVTISPASIIWTVHTSTKFGSLARVFQNIRNIESVLPSSKAAGNAVVEIDEDGVVAHAYQNAFRIA